MSKQKVLIVEPNRDDSESIRSVFDEFSAETVPVFSGRSALDTLSSCHVSLVVINTRLRDFDGSDFLNIITSKTLSIPVIAISDSASVRESVNVMRMGAVDYWVKPLDKQYARETVKNYLQQNSYKDVVLESDHSRQLFEIARRVAKSDVSVLVTGESGSGKEVICRYLHAQSSRAAAPFVAVNCAAIPENMLESLLFGYEKGAFTGAYQSHAGKFEQAQGGTILLDEISEIPTALQAKLLRVIQEKEVERICGNKPIALNVRVLATTNRNLKEEVSNGNFREDLYYRLNVFPLHLRPLRARTEDIIPLAKALINKHASFSAAKPQLSAAAELSLLGYKWPGNIRELENVIQRALVLAGGESITESALMFDAAEQPQPALVENGSSGLLEDAVKNSEQDKILEVMEQVNGSRKKAAAILGISDRTLRYKLAKLRDEGCEIPSSYNAKCA